MTELTPEEQDIAKNSIAVMLLRGVNPNNEPIFAYVGVQVSRLEDFIKAQQLGNFDPEEYGVIIEAGFGEPDEETRKKMEEEYGFNHEHMINLPTGQDE